MMLVVDVSVGRWNLLERGSVWEARGEPLEGLAERLAMGESGWGSSGRASLSPVLASLARGVWSVPCWNSLKIRLHLLYLQICLS